MQINAWYLTEGQRRRVNKQRAHQHNIAEEQKTRNLPNGWIVSLLEISIASAIKNEILVRSSLTDAYDTEPMSWNTGK